MTQLTGAGNRFMQLGFNDPADGMFIGGTGTAPAAGTSTDGGMIFLGGSKNANRSIPNPEFTQVTGEDGELLHQYDWNSIADRAFALEFVAEELAVYALLQNMPETTWLGGSFTYDDVIGAVVPNMTGILESRTKRVSDGIGRWGGLIIPNGTVRVLGRAGFTERGAALFRLYMTPQPSSYNQMGYSIVDSDGQPKYARGIPFNNLAHPVTAHAFKGDGATAAFAVDKSPVAVANVQATLERVNASVLSVTSSSPYGITLSANAGSGKRGIYWYLFQE